MKNIFKKWYTYVIIILVLLLGVLSYLGLFSSSGLSLSNEFTPGTYLIQDEKLNDKDKKDGYVGNIEPGDYKITTTLDTDYGSYLAIYDKKTGNILNNARLSPKGSKNASDNGTESVISLSEGMILDIQQGSTFKFEKIKKQ